MASINFTFQSGMSLKQIIGFETAGKTWSQFLGDDIEINIHVSMTQELPSTVIGGAIPVYVDTDVETVRNALGRDATSSEDELATQNLNVQIGDDGVLRYSGLVGDSTQQSAQMTLTQANAKALGIADPGTSGANPDGYIVLNSLQNSLYNWSYDYERTTAAPKGSLDLLSVALHEIGHIMGFTSGIDVMDGVPESPDKTTLLDLYRYSDRSLAVDAQELTAGEAAYFSIDGGQTNLAPFSEGITAVLAGIEGYQASHWADNALSGPIKDTTQVTPSPASINDLLTSLFAIAPPATAEDYVNNLNQLLADPESGSSGLPNFVSLQVDETSGGPSLGIMDPTLAPGERSAISALDVLAMDVLGYDLTGASSNVNYRRLLAEAEAAIAQKLGVSVEDLSANVDTRPLTQDRWQDILSAMNGRDEVYERRRKRQKTTSQIKWQEEGLDPTVLNIISDGAGDEAEILAYANHSLITTVEALPYAALLLRTVNLKGDDASDLIIPADDIYQTIDAGHGDNVVQLGRKGGNVTAGSGHDTIFSMGGKVIIDGGDGDNVLVLENQSDEHPRVTVGNGHDYIRTAGNSVGIIDGGGNNIIQVDAKGSPNIATGDGNDTIAVTGDIVTIAAGAGDNRIQAESERSLSLTTGAGNDTITLTSQSSVRVQDNGGNNAIQVDADGSPKITTGDGNDTIAVTGDIVTIAAGAGDNSIQAKSNRSLSLTTGDGNDTIALTSQRSVLVQDNGGNNAIQVDADGSPNITTGDGNDTIAVTGDIVTIAAGAGDNSIQSKSNRSLSLTTGDGNDTIALTSQRSVLVQDNGGNNDIQVDADGSPNITTGNGNDTIAVTGDVVTISAGGGDNHIRTESTRTTRITTENGNDYIVAGRQSDYVNAGGGNDRISGTNSIGAGWNERDTIITGDGNDIVVLGDRHQAYYRGDGTISYAYIKDFSDTDVLQLHGSADDYSLSSTYLLYRGDEIARFTTPVNFTLDGDQVYFVDATAPERDVSDLAAPNINISNPAINISNPAINISNPAIDIPSVNEMLGRVQTYHTTVELPVYSIVGGADAQFFTIDSYTGDLSWKRVPDDSTTLDANGDNKYDVIVQATIREGNTERDIDTQRLTITQDSIHNALNGSETENVETRNAIDRPDNDIETGDVETGETINNSDDTDDGTFSTLIFETPNNNNETDEAIIAPSIQNGGAAKDVRSISGQVRNDGDGDGDLTDLDGGIVGVTLKLFEDNNGDFKQDGRAIAKTTTDANGFYSFTDLADGNYIVKQVDLEGFSSTADVDGRWKGQIWSLTISGDHAFTGQDFLDASTMGPWAEAQT